MCGSSLENLGIEPFKCHHLKQASIDISNYVL